ncbi:MAG: hypothetical protein Q9195_009120 [Heterodermia aff. obscurata]
MSPFASVEILLAPALEARLYAHGSRVGGLGCCCGKPEVEEMVPEVEEIVCGLRMMRQTSGGYRHRSYCESDTRYRMGGSVFGVTRQQKSLKSSNRVGALLYFCSNREAEEMVCALWMAGKTSDSYRQWSYGESDNKLVEDRVDHGTEDSLTEE